MIDLRERLTIIGGYILDSRCDVTDRSVTCLVWAAGFEPATSRFQVEDSTKLSYTQVIQAKKKPRYLSRLFMNAMYLLFTRSQKPPKCRQERGNNVVCV